MAKILVRRKYYYPLVDFLWNLQDKGIGTDWCYREAGPGNAFENPFVDGKLLFSIHLPDNKPVAVIREDDPYKILLFDDSALGDIKKMLGGFRREETVIIEIQ